MTKTNPYVLFFTPTPELKKKLKMAHLLIDSRRFIKQNVNLSLMLSIGFSVIIFFLLSKQTSPSPIPLLTFPVFFFMFYTFLMRTPEVYIRRREKEINKNILFATRYLILKMDSGQPLLNSMISASKSHGIGGKFFQEIVDEINLGKPIEQALEDAHKYSASHIFQLVLRQILNSLRTGVDVSNSLRKMIDEITRQQQIEIKEYSKKLNSIVLFYLLVACVVPSLGISLFLVVGSMINLNLDITTYMVIILMLLLIQLFFIALIKSAKPLVEL